MTSVTVWHLHQSVQKKGKSCLILLSILILACLNEGPVVPQVVADCVLYMWMVQGEREDSYENRKSDPYRGGSRSPPFEEKYDRRNMERHGSGGRNDDRDFRSSYEERRSPGYDRGDYRRSPGRFDSVDERRQDDRNGNGNQIRSFEDRRFPDGLPRPEGRPVNLQKESKIPSPPMVRPVREILGEDVPPLRVGEPPKIDSTKAVNGSLQTQVSFLRIVFFVFLYFLFYLLFFPYYFRYQNLLCNTLYVLGRFVVCLYLCGKSGPQWMTLFCFLFFFLDM